MATYITSVDPGETAGVVQATLGPLGTPGAHIDWAGEVVWDDWITWWDIIEQSRIVICENFRLRPAKARHLGGSTLPTIRLIGALQCLCALNNKEFILYEPGSKGFYNRTMLKGLGFDHRSLHVRDAASHLFWHLRRRKKGT